MTDPIETHDDAGAPPAPQARLDLPRIALIACAAVVVVLIGLAALLWPSASDRADAAAAAPADPGRPALPEEAALPGRFAGTEGPCSRPQAALRVPALLQADAAYEAGEFARARDLYVDLLLSAGLGDEDSGVLDWAHGRLALSMAKLARSSGASLLDEPPLLFREEDAR